MRVEITGSFDDGAAVGFCALVPWLVGDRYVTFDLTGCDLIVESAERAVLAAMLRIEAAGGSVVVRRNPSLRPVGAF